MVCIQGILQVWLILIFLAGCVMYEDPELVFALLMGPDLYDVYLAMMMLSAVIWVVIEPAPSWYNPWWVERKRKKLYKYLSRMKLLMLLTEYWNYDKCKCTPTPFRWAQKGPSKTKIYCPRLYDKTKGGAKVKNKGGRAPYPRTTVCEGVRGGVTHEGVPTASDRITATGYDPGEDSPTEHIVHTVVSNVNTSFFAKGASCVRRFPPVLEGEPLGEAVPELPPLVVGSRRLSRDRMPTARMLESVQQEGLAFAATYKKRMQKKGTMMRYTRTNTGFRMR
jgi:hypothetical protein